MENKDSLGNRLKTYEALTTSTMLMPSLPVYARIDGRAFHTFCKGLNKPFCLEFVETMQEVTKDFYPLYIKYRKESSKLIFVEDGKNGK